MLTCLFSSSGCTICSYKQIKCICEALMNNALLYAGQCDSDADNGDDYDDFNNDDFDFDADDDDADDVQLVIRGELLEGKDSGLPIIKLQSASKRATNTSS